jgi:DNA-binding CsgD family transcriptional regulator
MTDQERLRLRTVLHECQTMVIGFTDAELEFAYFRVVECLSIREVAQQMSISPRTAEHYWRHILDKLGLEGHGHVSQLIARYWRRVGYEEGLANARHL